MIKTTKHWRFSTLFSSKAFQIITLIIWLIGQVVAAPSDLDVNFGINGWAITDIAGITANDSGYSIAIQKDGKIIHAGAADNGADIDIVIVRYNADGTLDPSFGINGITTTDIGSRDNFARKVAVQNDGKIIVAGGTENGSDRDFLIIRYNSDGSLDQDFDGNSGSGNGILSYDITGANDEIRGLTILPNGKIIASGSAGDLVNGVITLIQLNPDGTLDTTFDGDTGNANGIIETSIIHNSLLTPDITTQPDGKLIIVGTQSNDFLIVRFNPDGSLDTSFDGNSGNGNGIVTLNLFITEFGTGVATQTDGKIIILGSALNAVAAGSQLDFVVIRLNSDGSLDTSFDGNSGTGNGAVSIDIAGSDYAYSIAYQSDGNILIAGASQNRTDMALTRLLSDGRLDASFNSSGTKALDLGGQEIAYSLSIDCQNFAIVGGSVNGDFGLARLDLGLNHPPIASNGSLTTNEGGIYKFSTNDFGYSDMEMDDIAEIDILSPPTSGSLFIDLNGNEVNDGGTEVVSAQDTVTKAVIDAGQFSYLPLGADNSSFTFSVNDGTNSSCSSYDMALSVNPQPTVIIEQANSQRDPSDTASVIFNVIFSEPVTGFSNADIILSGTANPSTAVISEISPNNNTSYQLTVLGMNSNGTVMASIPEKVVFDAEGAQNRASTSNDNVVSVNIDEDNDGIVNSTDNCPSISNPTQSDSNGNNIGDACDSPIVVKGGGSIDLVILFLLSLVALIKTPHTKKLIKSCPSAHLGIIALFALSFLSLIPSVSKATEDQALNMDSLYIGGTLGLAHSNPSLSEFNQALQTGNLNAKAIDKDSDRLAWRLNLGYELNNKWAIELGYLDLGEVDIKFEGSYSDSGIFFNTIKKIHPESGKGWELAGIYRQAILDRFSAFAKAGLFTWRGNYDASQFGATQGEHKTSGTNFLFGLGAGIRVFKNWQVDAQVERFELDSDSTYFASMSLKYHFETTNIMALKPSTRSYTPPKRVEAPIKPPSSMAESQESSTSITTTSFLLDIKFEAGKTKISQSHHSSLTSLANFMMKHPDMSVVIEGHADKHEKESEQLSTDRAKSAQSYLIHQLGINASRLSFISHGSRSPITSEVSLLKLNRRVVVKVGGGC